MKQTYLFILMFFIIFNKTNAQTTDVVTGLNWPTDMQIVGNYMYFTDDISNKIYKKDITNSSLPIEIVSLNSKPYRILLRGNELYISMYDENQTTSKISKIDITQVNPVPIDIISGLYISDGIAILDNYLYVCESGAGRIIKFDLTQINPIPIVVILGLSQPSAILFIGNDLYISTIGDNKISKIDVTEITPNLNTVVSGFSSPTGLTFDANDLYITDSGAGKILKINITDAIPNIIEIINGLNFPRMCLISNNQLFIANSGAGKIIKLNSFFLSVPQNNVDSELKLFPNPSNQNIQFTNLYERVNYSIYNSAGLKVKAGNIIGDEKIYIQNLSSGLYIIELKNQIRIKFIKE